MTPGAPTTADGGGETIATAAPPWRAREALAQPLHFCRAAALPLLAAQGLSASATPRPGVRRREARWRRSTGRATGQR